MKKHVIALLTLAGIGLSCSTLANHHYGMAGCGLGAMAFKDQPGKIQIVAATVNNLISPQTFAITTGTSNCTEDPSKVAAMYIQINEVALRKDISRGAGETIVGLSKIYQCSDASAFSSTLQKNFEKIYPSAAVKAPEISKAIEATIKQEKNLACNAA